ncbi:uncharacterized protein LOC118179614 [Stegodyphus dumicola]|uniref:uncharacterized protein LOC118179614 n=1 Tax=Stegodyphus dumicola TaxID=202533 RepID=UPI0015AFAF89|nr:uncharacterized protein LOC118179614 [Stegodyphus dumicola]
MALSNFQTSSEHSYASKRVKTNENANAIQSKIQPRFVVINDPTGELKKMSPFVINKYIQGIAGEPKFMKRLRSGDLLIETISPIQAVTFLGITRLGNLDVSASAHKTLNHCRGVISQLDLLSVSEEEFVTELSSQNVCAAKRIEMRKDGQLIDTKHVILTFSSADLPKSVKAGYLHCPVRPYLPNPMRCFQCQRFGHSKISCRGKPTCARCSVEGHDSDNCNAASLCINCKGEHTAYSRSCPKWKAEKEVQALKVTRNITYAEARKIIASTQPRSNVSYANAAAKSVKSVAIQTNLTLRGKKENSEPVNPNKNKLIQTNATKNVSGSNISDKKHIK